MSSKSIDFVVGHDFAQIKEADSDLYRMQKELANGLIDQQKCINLDIDGYYKNVLSMKSERERKILENMTQFKKRTKERRLATKLPFERI